MRKPLFVPALLLVPLFSLVACAQPADPGQPDPPAPAVTTAAATMPETDPVPVHLQQGQQLYQHWCAACHARGPGHPGTQALEARYGGLMPGALEDRTNLTPEVIEIFVRNGISIMPFFRKTEISDQELAAIGAYLSHNPTEQPATGPAGGQP